MGDEAGLPPLLYFTEPMASVYYGYIDHTVGPVLIARI